ncbi:serine palmitoyltransferase [Aureimonas leprariae]|uniref:Pyridoxal phosphate-dependent aminotransferase family protein n=1 Tax=Plantimonas leprariae TaxID=2615207 RepID=A0A7V7PLE4_9HYPH|nr:pyridoxal phosphate-dependent aminotransferase family protein [Aureimonas leprariae]KAB0677188.1 pyridoxal phosphate-dependent aminotransferase family protein [Aureimonas leprariae]
MSILEKFKPLRAAHDRLKALGRDPFSVTFDDIVSPTEGILDGRRTVLLGTNNYLGLTFDDTCIEGSIDAIVRHGTGTTGSRIANGSYDEHENLEKELAAFFGRRHGMVFSTGYQANLGILSTLVGKDDHLIIDADSHASIYDGSRLGHAPVIRFRHNDPEDLAKRLRRLGDAPGARLIVTEGIYSMLGDMAPLREIAAVKREYGAYLLVDEAHSMGVLGARGRGLAEEVAAEADVDIIIGTFSKSLGSVGGFCVSDLEDFDIVRLACRPYMFTASLPPAVIASTRFALKKLQQEPGLRAQLTSNARQLYTALQAQGFQVGPQCSPIVSVILPDPQKAMVLWNALLENGLYMNLALPPATPSSSAFLRSSVSARHTPEQIAFAANLMGRMARELGILEAAEPEPIFNRKRAAGGARAAG